jgi:hypothetical protein
VRQAGVAGPHRCEVNDILGKLTGQVKILEICAGLKNTGYFSGGEWGPAGKGGFTFVVRYKELSGLQIWVGVCESRRTLFDIEPLECCCVNQIFAEL